MFIVRELIELTGEMVIIKGGYELPYRRHELPCPQSQVYSLGVYPHTLIIG